MAAKKKVGRPSSYDPKMVKEAREYIKKHEEHDDPVPTVAGLASVIGTTRKTIYEWIKSPENAEFRDILEELLQKQERVLIRNGLLNAFNAPITKMMLTKHGYSDKIENEVSGPGGGPIVQKIERTIVDPKEV